MNAPSCSYISFFLNDTIVHEKFRCSQKFSFPTKTMPISTSFELKTLELWILRSMLELLFLLISRLIQSSAYIQKMCKKFNQSEWRIRSRWNFGRHLMIGIIRTNICRDQLLNFLSVGLYPLSFYLNSPLRRWSQPIIVLSDVLDIKLCPNYMKAHIISNNRPNHMTWYCTAKPNGQIFLGRL